MHLIVPFSAPSATDERVAGMARAALGSLALRGFRRMPLARDEGDADSWTPPHERAFGRAHGWQADDGLWPLAARQAAADGLAVAGQGVAQVTPTHARVGVEGVSLVDAGALALDEAHARALFERMRVLFEGAGVALHWSAPQRWLAVHEMFATLPAASLDRVVGRPLDHRWLPAGAPARAWRRLQNEAQMLLHEAPENEARDAAGLPPVNTLWLSGSGRAQPDAATEPVQVDARLRAAALTGDWDEWARQWRALAAALAEQRPRRLTLCGEGASLTLAAHEGWRAWLAAAWPALGGAVPLARVLETL